MITRARRTSLRGDAAKQRTASATIINTNESYVGALCLQTEDTQVLLNPGLNFGATCHHPAALASGRGQSVVTQNSRP